MTKGKKTKRNARELKTNFCLPLDNGNESRTSFIIDQLTKTTGKGSLYRMMLIHIISGMIKGLSSLPISLLENHG